jgi:hypothetical protein
VGERYFARRSLRSSQSAPRGILDSLSQYQQREQRLDHVAPSVRAFFEETSTLSLEIEPRWRAWAALFGWLWHGLARLLGQLCIPVVRSTIETELFALAGSIEGRSAARGVWRRYAGGRATMQVIVYSVLEEQGEGFMSASFPLPLSVLEGILRLECVDEDERALSGARLTSDRRPSRDRDPVGVFLHTPLGRVRLPLGESLTLWDAGSSKAPPALSARARATGATVVGLHEQRLFGAVMVQHWYWFRPARSAHGSGTGS